MSTAIEEVTESLQRRVYVAGGCTWFGYRYKYRYRRGCKYRYNYACKSWPGGRGEGTGYRMTGGVRYGSMRVQVWDRYG